MLYNNPIAYRTDFRPEHVAELAQAHANLVAVKESSADIRRIAAIRHRLGDRLQILVGVDDLIVEGIAAGATGWVAGLVNAMPVESVRLFELATRANAADAATRAGAGTPRGRRAVPLVPAAADARHRAQVRAADQARAAAGGPGPRARARAAAGARRRRARGGAGADRRQAGHASRATTPDHDRPPPPTPTPASRAWPPTNGPGAWAEFPQLATSVGDASHDDRLERVDAASRAARLARWRDTREALAAIPVGADVGRGAHRPRGVREPAARLHRGHRVACRPDAAQQRLELLRAAGRPVRRAAAARRRRLPPLPRAAGRHPALHARAHRADARRAGDRLHGAAGRARGPRPAAGRDRRR